MLKIRVDIQQEYSILVCARRTANMRRKSKEGQYCFVEQDVECHDKLEYLNWVWLTKACAEKQKWLVPLMVLDLSEEDQDYYHEQKNIIKLLQMRTLTGMPADMKKHKLVIALTLIVSHGMLILNCS